MPKYRDIADDLRAQIERGDLPAGSKLPFTDELVDRYSASKQTIRNAVEVLAQEGLVIAKRRYGTVVRDRSGFRIPLSRYKASLESDGQLGPFEAACARQGLNGEMRTVGVDHVRDPDVAGLLGLPAEDELICRRRDACVEDQVVQFQHAWYPMDIALRAGLDRQEKVVGGVYGALERAGIPVVEADEEVGARPPTKEEARQLGIGVTSSVLTVERITRNDTGRPIEVARVVAAADRTRLTYEGIRLPRKESE